MIWNWFDVLFWFYFFLLNFTFCVCRLLVVFAQELLRSIHQELPLERIRGCTPCQHGPKQRAQFASSKRVMAVLRKLQDTGVEAFLEPVGVNMKNVNSLLDVVADWLFSALGPSGFLHEPNPSVWDGMRLSMMDVHRIVVVAVAQTAMKLKFLNMYIDIQTMRRNAV